MRLGFRRELDALDDPAGRQSLFDEYVEAAYQSGKALNSATAFEIDAHSGAPRHMPYH